MLEIVRHEAAQKMRVWPLGVGLQEQASKHLKLLWSKAMVVSVEEKAWQRLCQVGIKEMSVSEPLMRRRKHMDEVKTGLRCKAQDEFRVNLFTA